MKFKPQPITSFAMSSPARKWTFEPHPLLKNGHLHSIVGIHWPFGAVEYQAKRHSVFLDDGDQLMLHEDAALGTDEYAPIVLLIHGLGGCHQSTYMRRNAERFSARGYRVFRMDMRGCGAGERTAILPTHCGRSADVAAALQYIAELYPDTETSIVGYSMGGTLTLNMLAEAGEMRIGNLQRSMAICSPTDLAHVENHFRSFLGRRYDRFFVRLIWSQILRRWQHFPDTAINPAPRRPKRLRDIDELVIAPSGGFSSAEDYYDKASPGPKLASIRQPVTIVFSEDDPIVPIGPLLGAKLSSSIELITTRHGGHLGFLSARHDDPDFRWLDWRILDWLEDGNAKPLAFDSIRAVEQESRRQEPQTAR